MTRIPRLPSIVAVRPLTAASNLALGPISAAALLRYARSATPAPTPSAAVIPLRSAAAQQLFATHGLGDFAPVELLPSGETKAAMGLPAGEGLPRRVYDFVMARGGDFTPPTLFKAADPRHRQLLAEQLQISRPGQPPRQLVEMPLAAVTDPLWPFLDPSREKWAQGWRWLADPKLNVPLLISTPNAQADPRGVMLLFHGACGKNSGPHSLVQPGNQFIAQGFAVVCAPTPFHVGFGPVEGAHFDMASHLAWRARIAEASLDYFQNKKPDSLPRVLVGRSTGANEALEFAHRHPNSVQAVVAISPYHPAWWELDELTLDIASKYGAAQKNDEGTAWNNALDRGQWTFMGQNIPAFPSQAPTSRETVEAFFKSMVDNIPPNERRAHSRLSVLEQLPHAVRNYPKPLVELTPAVLQQLLPGVELPTVQSDSFLAITQTPILIYVAGADLEYTTADIKHFIVWVLAAAQNPNVKIVLAPRGDHDPWQTSDKDSIDASKAFQAYLKTWLDGITPREQKPSTVTWGVKLDAFHMAWKMRQAAQVPTEAKIMELRQTDPAAADRFHAQKLAIVDTVNAVLGTQFTHEEMVTIGERLLENGGRLKKQGDKMVDAIVQLTAGALTWKQAKATVSSENGLLFADVEATLTKVLGKSPFTPLP